MIFEIVPHISEKTVDLAKQGRFTVRVPYSVNKGALKSVLNNVFKLSPLEIKVINKKSITQKRAKKTSVDKGYKKFIVKLQEKQIMPGYETFLAEAKQEEKKNKKTTEKK